MSGYDTPLLLHASSSLTREMEPFPAADDGVRSTRGRALPLMFASPVAIGAIFCIGAIAQYTAFTTPLALKLFFARDKFKPGELKVQNMIGSQRLIQNSGPWNLGRWSKPVGTVAVAWLLLIVPALCCKLF